MSHHNSNRPRRPDDFRNNRPQGREGTPCPPFNFGKDMTPELVGNTADKIAQSFGKTGGHRDCDKSTQLRKFYDEVVKLNQRSLQEGFQSVQVHVHMLKAKAAYAKGRKHVSSSFEKFIEQGINHSRCKDSFSNFKLLFEAFLGFYKKYDKS